MWLSPRKMQSGSMESDECNRRAVLPGISLPTETMSLGLRGLISPSFIPEPLLSWGFVSAPDSPLIFVCLGKHGAELQDLACLSKAADRRCSVLGSSCLTCVQQVALVITRKPGASV